MKVLQIALIKYIDIFGKVTEVTIYKVAATEFGKSVVKLKFYQSGSHKSNSESIQLIDGRSSKKELGTTKTFFLKIFGMKNLIYEII